MASFHRAVRFWTANSDPVCFSTANSPLLDGRGVFQKVAIVSLKNGPVAPQVTIFCQSSAVSLAPPFLVPDYCARYPKRSVSKKVVRHSLLFWYFWQWKRKLGKQQIKMEIKSKKKIVSIFVSPIGLREKHLRQSWNFNDCRWLLSYINVVSGYPLYHSSAKNLKQNNQ